MTNVTYLMFLFCVVLAFFLLIFIIFKKYRNYKLIWTCVLKIYQTIRPELLATIC